MRELIFKLSLSDGLSEDYKNLENSQDFTLIDSPGAFLSNITVLFRHFGFKESVKTFLKSFVGNRVFYYLSVEGSVAACGTLAIGFCRFYSVKDGDVVIGSVWTEEKLRGRNLATRSIRHAIHAMYLKGYKTFYIDTQVTNKPMLRAIEKLGFGESIDSYES
ncbi:GNAT family N-acetyltransferase [Endozoicomonas lisbonensis]|uniref:Ribosomal protein S18 acetylase RimI-like enzyme n=1 Tax=Endozoicomonas lisbonensis TaxID=3120522 RepID=A0ABV2SBY2_9GAMM